MSILNLYGKVDFVLNSGNVSTISSNGDYPAKIIISNSPLGGNKQVYNLLNLTNSYGPFDYDVFISIESNNSIVNYNYSLPSVNNSFLTLLGGNLLTNAQSNTQALQSALNSSGKVTIQPGTYYITGSPITIPSYKVLDLTDVTLICYGTGACYNLFQNANFNASPQTVTAISYSQPVSSGNPGNRSLLATVTFSAKPVGFTVGGFIELLGDSTGFSLGIWKVQSINLSNNQVVFQTFNSSYLPANQSSLNWTAYVADGYIAIVGKGGVINGNYSSGLITGTQTTYNEHGVCFNHVTNLIMEDVELRDFSLYAFCSAHTQNPRVNNVTVNNRLDGIHYYGPNFQFAVIENLHGSTGDDSAIFQTVDSTPYYTRVPPNGGGSWYGGGRMTNIRTLCSSYTATASIYPNGGITSNTGMAFYGTYVVDGAGSELGQYTGQLAGSTSAAFGLGNGQPYASSMDKLVLKDISGFILLDNTNTATITIPEIVIDNYLCKSASFSNVGVMLGINVDSVVINSPNIDPIAYSSASIITGVSAQTYAVVKSVVINTPHLASNTNASVTLIDPVAAGGSIGQIVINAPVINQTNGPGFILNNSSAWGNTPNIIINDADLSTLTNYPITIGAGTVDLTVNRGKFNPSQTPFNFYGSGLVTLTGGDVNESGTPNLFANSANVKIKKWRRGALPTYYTPATGNTITLSVKTGDESCIINPAGALAALTIAFPSNANSIDGETRDARITQAIAVLSSTGTVLGLPATTPAGFSRTFIFNSTANAWM